MAPDPLATVEFLAVVEEATRALRHDVRNHMASIRNRAFFVRRKLAQEASAERDPRTMSFLEGIDQDVQQTDDTIEHWSARLQGLRAVKSGSLAVAAGLKLAADAARLPNSVVIELEAPADELRVIADLELLALAVRCLLENAGEAAGPGPVRVTARAQDGRCEILVSDRGPGLSDAARRLDRFFSTKPGRLGLGLCIAQRVASRFRGGLVLGTPALGAEVGLSLPLAPGEAAP